MPGPKRIIIVLSVIIFIFLLSKSESIEELTLAETASSNKIEYKAENLTDPFQEEKIEIEKEPQTEEVKPLPPLTIQGIIWGGAFPQAIINNKVVKIGDTIGEVRIIDISKNGISVLFGNHKYNLSVPSASEAQSLKKETQRPPRR
jgi:hypothetical protein